jgi:hypothetical protein
MQPGATEIETPTPLATLELRSAGRAASRSRAASRGELSCCRPPLWADRAQRPDLQPIFVGLPVPAPPAIDANRTRVNDAFKLVDGFPGP